MMLAEPHFVETNGVDVFDELEVSLQRERRIGAGTVERRDEVPEPELGHYCPFAVAMT